jgi:uncharacterized membrane protein
MNSTIKSLSARIALAAVMTAVAAVFTLLIRIPFAPTRGYINLCDAAVYFAAFTFGPVTAFISGGLGPAIADIISGYAQWAPITFLAHGLQGLTAGLVAWQFFKKTGKGFSLSSPGLYLGWLTGTLVMISLYFGGGLILAGLSAAAEIPMNLIQNLAGLLAGSALSQAVQKAYPPVINYRW